MILSEIWAESGRLLNDPNNTRWTTDILTARANLAQTEIQGYTNAIKSRESITVTAGTGGYSLNTNTIDIIRMYKVFTDGSARPLTGITREELDFLFPDWNNWQQGEPTHFIYDGTNQQVVLVPTPDSSVSLLSVYESRKPAALASSTDIPFDSNNQLIPYHIAIVHWVVAQCWMDNGDTESLAKSKFHKSGSMLRPGQYEDQLGRIMAEFDSPEATPIHILWQPQGGRIGTWFIPNKSNPMAF